SEVPSVLCVLPFASANVAPPTPTSRGSTRDRPRTGPLRTTCVPAPGKPTNHTRPEASGRDDSERFLWHFPRTCGSTTEPRSLVKRGFGPPAPPIGPAH